MTRRRRIASLLPSSTEIVCAVGARDELVGISHECDHPPSVAGLPVLTRPRRAFPSSSGGIDRTVRELLAAALTVYEVDVDRLRDAAPDVIVTQDLCDVCAVSLGDVRRALRELADADVDILSLRPLTLGDVWNDVRRVGTATGREALGRAAADALEDACRRIAGEADRAAKRPAVLTIEWLDPVMIGGTWMPELVEAAGGEALVTRPGDHAPTLDRDALAALDPDVVLVKPCGYDLERTRNEAPLLRTALPWDTWRAVRSGHVFVADGNAFFNRPGPRLVESLEILAACLHGALFPDLVRKHLDHVLRVGPDLSFTDLSR